jgi:tRNA wybutosine-synthesizing protein 3
MVRDSFLQRKKDVLSKADKSSIGEWDEKIKSLCNKINSLEDFYTTSSCSGRIILMVEQDKKAPGLFVKVWHDKINFEDLEREISLKNGSNKNIKFKTESPIIHVACKDLNLASDFLEKAKHAGFKRSGILSLGKNIMLELNSTEKLEFPVINNGKVLVGEEFLSLVVKNSNEKLEKGWQKISVLEKYL